MQLPSFAYTVDKTNHVVNVTPGSSPAATTTDLRNAFNYLSGRTDKTTQWTMKFAPGNYVLSAQVAITGLQNTIISSDPKNQAHLSKVAGWNSASSAEYLLYFRMAQNVQLLGFHFTGSTDFSKSVDGVWPDQGVYFGSCNIIKVDSNTFDNFGDAALRVVTDAHDPIAGVNSFKTEVSNNKFNNIYQTATTATDMLHGGTAQSTWINNTYTNLRGSAKFSTRTPGGQTIQFLNNVINGGNHYGLEIDNYSNFQIQGNTFENIQEYAMTIYTNGSGDLMKSGFPWGDGFTISKNIINNVGYGIRYDHRPFWDGTQNTPKNLVIDSNTITGVTNTTSYTPVITVTGGPVNGVQVTNNKMSQITNKNFISILSTCTNVTKTNNSGNGTLLK